VIDFLRRDDEWWCEAENVPTCRDDEHAAFSTTVDDGDRRIDERETA